MGPRTLDMMRWCLVPYWAKDIKVSFANINAMAETVDTKRAFRDAFARRRCLVPTIEAVYELEEARAEGEAALCDRARRRRVDGASGLSEN